MLLIYNTTESGKWSIRMRLTVSKLATVFVLYLKENGNKMITTTPIKSFDKDDRLNFQKWL